MRARAAAPCFAGWVVVGAFLAADLLCVVSALYPLLVLTVPTTVLLARWLGRRTDASVTRWGIAAGVSALPFFLAYSNRRGPGTSCHPIGTPRFPGRECGDFLDPRPFLAAGVLLLLLPFGRTIVRRRQGGPRAG